MPAWFVRGVKLRTQVCRIADPDLTCVQGGSNAVTTANIMISYLEDADTIFSV